MTAPPPAIVALQAGAPDMKLLNYALNLEYLAAQFYSFAATGVGVAPNLLGGTGDPGEVRNGHRVPFADPTVARYASELADDKLAALTSLRSLVAVGPVGQPHIDLAGTPLPTATPMPLVDPFSDDTSFLNGAVAFEDAAVAVFSDLLPKVQDAASAGVVSSLLADTTYHAGLLRSTLLGRSLAGRTAVSTATAEAATSSNDAAAAGDGAPCSEDQPHGQCLTGAMAALSRYFPNDVNGEMKLSSG